MKKFVAVGHVDLGKSTLCGHLLYKCGYIDEREMNKIREKAKKDNMEKWVWSRVLDIYEEEMERGKTHEFTTVEFEYKGNQYQLIDTPGHRSFVRSMIEGISEDVNIAVVLVSVAENEFEASFERGMLKEHIILAKAVGIENLLVLANKMDLIDWDEKLCKKAIKKVTKYLVKDLKWDRTKLSVVPISALNGEGLLDTDGIPDWYKGKSFFGTLDAIPETKRASSRDIVLPDEPTTRYTVDITILNTGGAAITVGYNCVMHFNGTESEISIEKIKGKPVLRSGSETMCVIELPYKETIGIGTRVIFRKDDYTVGYGKVVKALCK